MKRPAPPPLHFGLVSWKEKPGGGGVILGQIITGDNVWYSWRFIPHETGIDSSRMGAVHQGWD